ncbi:hypothetical protein BDZ94DRAFT_1152261 [Collybia nuda]|uniref:Uncharacterized protein n=1 Tax=Collybia nuda TaxID=64659 RepID=A0A9P5YHA3_9AGAR|nr:hypothetical protein BDZ94DRAFT_1152261 [Collybia nuda]
MYYLDTPPPNSRFRRPWSPEPYDPLPSTSRGGQGVERMSQFPEDDHPQRLPKESQIYRENSDVSVEALDLADYAMTLRTRQAEGPYPPFSQPISYPPSSMRPLESKTSLRPPSVSRGETISSNTHTSTSQMRGSRSRPFSLPPSSRDSSAASNRMNPSLYLGEHQIRPQDQNLNISHFPPWSRSWYRTNNLLPSSPPDIYTPIPTSHLNSTNQSPFDPGYVHKEHLSNSDPYSYAPTSSFGHDSTRDLLPWSNDPPDYGSPIDASIKEERIRMLEREFGPKAKGKARDVDRFVDEGGKPLIGTVDDGGNLVTQGPRKRIAIRCLQILMAFAASVPAIYAALVIKPKEAPPPAAKPPAFVLYILSVLTLLILLYLFVARPCCCGRKRRKGSQNNPLAGGMMVLPVQGIPGGKKGKKPKGERKGNGRDTQGDVQVNLIVDPGMFGRRDDESDEDEDEEWESSFPSSYETGPARKQRRRAHRRSVFAGLAMEEEWKRARAWAKKLALVDGVGMILWGAVFVFILIGKRCPSGSFEGWCNAYNVSSAAACILCVAFGISVFFDVKDLHASKASPRTWA